MKIRALHIFSPNYKNCFSGSTIRWKTYFSRWNASSVVHHILDVESNQISISRTAFNFEYMDAQRDLSRFDRAIWVYHLFKSLIKHRDAYDILHVHILWWGSLLLGLWSKRNNIPAIYESVLLDADTPGQLSRGKLGKFKIQLLRRYKAIMTISEALEEDYRKFGFSDHQVFTLMNCVDQEVFFPPKSAEEKALLRKKWGLPTDATILLFVGSVIERKGVDVLIKAFIQAGLESEELYLLVIGPKTTNENPSLDEDFINGLYTQLRSHDLSTRAIFTGMIQDRRELAEMYRASDIFVFPSNREGLPNVVLEAMASGLPVVVSHLPVLENIINHGENGFFVPIGDVDALVDEILLLVDDPVMARKIRNNARHYIEENHSFEVWQAKLEKFYKKLLLQCEKPSE